MHVINIYLNRFNSFEKYRFLNVLAFGAALHSFLGLWFVTSFSFFFKDIMHPLSVIIVLYTSCRSNQDNSQVKYTRDVDITY